MKLIAVNGRSILTEVLRDALKAGKGGTTPLELLIENTDYYKPISSITTAASATRIWCAMNRSPTCCLRFTKQNSSLRPW